VIEGERERKTKRALALPRTEFSRGKSKDSNEKRVSSESRSEFTLARRIPEIRRRSVEEDGNREGVRETVL